MLESSTDPKVVNAAKTIKSSGSADIKFPFAKGEGDSKSPDRSFKHKKCECKPRCVHPTLVVEIGWSQEMKYLQEKAEAYICRSKGQIRTVVAVYMRKMYLAEVKNENRLYRAYLAGEADENESYSSDVQNETCEASVLVWRAVVRRNGTVDAVRVQNEVRSPCDLILDRRLTYTRGISRWKRQSSPVSVTTPSATRLSL